MRHGHCIAQPGSFDAPVLSGTNGDNFAAREQAGTKINARDAKGGRRLRLTPFLVRHIKMKPEVVADLSKRDELS